MFMNVGAPFPMFLSMIGKESASVYPEVILSGWVNRLQMINLLQTSYLFMFLFSSLY